MVILSIWILFHLGYPRGLLYVFVLSWNHRVVWVITGLKDHLIPVSLPWTGLPLTRPGYSKPEVFLEALFVQFVRAPF